jgi:eukaryotic-like serine/threonine-protein kinase
MVMMGGERNQAALSGAKPFGKYYLLERIGAGGMAEVFLAVAIGPEGFQRRLVIKRMLPHLSQDRTFVRMFVDEAKLCGMLSHPNLVQIFEFGSIDESFFIAMEHVQGETLLAVRAKLADQARVAPIAASLEIARQVCLGLHYAHSLQSATGQSYGIVHRDISPSNLMLSFHGGVKILDFGIARVAEEMRESHTQAGTLKGKVSYMSPEQIRTEHIDCRSDIFAVGIVLHEMLTARRLFKGSNELNGARMVLEAVVPLPSTLNPQVTPEVDRVVMRALQRNPNERYQTAGELADDLEKALFEMRASPHEVRKLLVSLFPDGPARTEISLPATPLPLDRSHGAVPSPVPMGALSSANSAPTKALGADSIIEVEPASAGQPFARRRSSRRKWATLGGLAGIVIAVVVLAHPPWAVAPHEPTVAPAGAQAVPAPVPEPLPPPPAKTEVSISFDSTPQEAQVIREDSGEVVGRTPMALKLPLGHEVIAFRFEKPGHASTTYRVIPDLDKAVRAELTVEPAAVVKPTVSAHSRRPTPPRGRGGAPAARDARPVARDGKPIAPAETAAPAADQPRSCLLSVGSFPWTELWIDGKDTGQRTPVVHYPVTCGAHKLGLKRRDLKMDRTEHVTVAPGHEIKQHYDLSDQYGGD